MKKEKISPTPSLTSTNQAQSSHEPKALKLIKLQSVRQQIEVSSKTLERMEKRGELMPIRINGTRYWRQEDLDQLIAGGDA